MYGVSLCCLYEAIPVVDLYRLSSGPKSSRRQRRPVVLVTGISQSVARTLKEVSMSSGTVVSTE